MPTANVTGKMTPVDLQRSNEYYYAQKHINKYALKEIQSNPQTIAKRDLGVKLLEDWIEHWKAPFTTQCTTEAYYLKKNLRLKLIEALDLKELVTDIFAHIALIAHTPELFVSCTAQLAAKLGFDEKRDAIQTVAEIISVLSNTDAFDLTKEQSNSSVMVLSNIVLSPALKDAIERSQFMPPMVCTPPEVKHNYDSPMLTYNECQILGKQNGHSGDICLDVINKQNEVPLQLDTHFLSTVEEEPTFEIDSLEKSNNWMTFKKQSHEMYKLLVRQGNQFYLTNKVDKRGRLYSSGYHINTQGSAYKKAMIELANEEVVQGVPSH